MLYFCRNAAVFAIAIVSAVLGWLFGGTRGELLPSVVPWLFVFLLEIVVFFPQRHRGETLYDARARVWHDLKKGKLVWLVLIFMGLLLIPFVNVGLCPICDAKLIATGVSPEPLVSILPFCVSCPDHLNVVFWFIIALMSMIAVRYCLTRSGKRLLIELLVWNGTILAILGFVQEVMDAPGPLWSTMSGLKFGAISEYFSTFGYPNMAGDYFTTLFGCAIALWRRQLDEIHEKARKLRDEAREAANKSMAFWRKHYFLIPAGIFFFAAINTFSRAAIMLVTLSAVIYFAHSFIALTWNYSKARKVKVGTICVGILGLIVFVAVNFMPDKVQKEVDTLSTIEVLDRVSGRGQYHTRVATEIWKEYPFFGCGGWGYRHFCIPKMTPEERKQIQRVGGINVHNDYLQFLCEHGVVGFGLLVTMVLMLLWPIYRQWCSMMKDARFSKEARKRIPKPRQIFILPAPVFILLMTIVATFIHGFGDCPFRSPAVLTLFFIILATLRGFMPKKG